MYRSGNGTLPMPCPEADEDEACTAAGSRAGTTFGAAIGLIGLHFAGTVLGTGVDFAGGGTTRPWPGAAA